MTSQSSVSVRNFKIPAKVEYSGFPAYKLVQSVTIFGKFLSSDIYCRSLSRIDSRQYNIGRIFSPPHYRFRSRNHVCIQLIHPDVSFVYIFLQSMQDLPFGITQIALYFTQQSNRCDNRHILEHHFFPFFMIPFRLSCNTRIQIIINNLSPNRIGNHRRDKVTVLLQCRSEFFTLSRTRRKHNIRSGLQIILMYNIIDIAILSVCLTHNTQFQLIKIFIERLRTVFHFCRLTIPSSGLFGIGLIKCRKFII